MTRVVIVANNIEELGGAQRVAHVLTYGLGTRGYDVELIGLVPKPAKHEYGIHGRTLLDEPLAAKRDSAERNRQRQLILAALRDVLQSGPPGIVITVQVWAMEHVREVVDRTWRLIGQYHSSYAAAAESGDLLRLLASYRDVDWFTPLTDADARAFVRAGLNNVMPMPNAIHPWPSEPAAGDARTITVLGRLAPEKGPDIALAAWERIAAQYPDWQLQFVGDGPMRVAGQQVAVLPPTTDPLTTLRETGVYCLPSRTEGMPLALAEAMASGLPVVASDCSAGVRQLVGDCGMLVPSEDPSALADALARVLSSAELRADLGSRARLRMADYRLDSVMDRWDWLLTQTLR